MHAVPDPRPHISEDHPVPSMAEVKGAHVVEEEYAASVVRDRPVRWYRHWIFATVMLCCYGFFKEFKPSEPFLNPYLTSEVKNFTQHEVIRWNIV